MAITLYEGNNTIDVSLTPIIILANLFGVVTDAQTGLPLDGVKVTINGSTTYTDSSGNYGFEGLEPGTYSLEFSKAGYETVVM